MDEIFAKRLAELVKTSDLSYKELAETLNFKSKSTIFKYAHGKTVNLGPTAINKIANFFKVSPSWLAGYTNDKYYNTDFDK